MLIETTSPIEVPAVAASRQDVAAKDGDSALGVQGVGSRVMGGTRIVLPLRLLANQQHLRQVLTLVQE